METGTPDSIMTVYDTKDVNHSGTVDLNDVVSVNKYLLGMYYGNHYPWLDANQNLIVDAADSKYILNSLVSINSAPYRFVSREYNDQTNTVTESLVSPPAISTPITPDGSATATDSRTYWKHIYASGISNTQYTEYTLTPSTTSIPTTSMGDQPSSIVDGEDNRYTTTLSENTGIVRINGNGTGFIIGDHLIATAGHVVYNKNTYAYYFNNCTIETYNEDGTLSGETLHPIEAHLPALFVSLPPVSDFRYDYGLIVVQEDLSDYTHFSLGETYNLFPTQFSTIPIYVTGYKGSGNNLASQKGSIISPNVYTQSQTQYVLNHNVDTFGGDSGAPIYTITKDGLGNYSYTAIGIHTGGGNIGPRITRYQLQFYLGNSNIASVTQ